MHWILFSLLYFYWLKLLNAFRNVIEFSCWLAFYFMVQHMHIFEQIPCGVWLRVFVVWKTFDAAEKFKNYIKRIFLYDINFVVVEVSSLMFSNLSYLCSSKLIWLSFIIFVLINFLQLLVDNTNNGNFIVLSISSRI